MPDIDDSSTMWRIYVHPGINLTPTQVGKIRASTNSTAEEVLEQWVKEKPKESRLFSDNVHQICKAFPYQILWGNSLN